MPRRSAGLGGLLAVDRSEEIAQDSDQLRTEPEPKNVEDEEGNARRQCAHSHLGQTLDQREGRGHEEAAEERRDRVQHEERPEVLDQEIAVADQITDGVWLVGRLGWDQFYFSATEDWDKSRYVNGLNHPGFSGEAIEELIRIMEQKQVKISGIAADSFSTDSGQGAKGTDDNWSNAWPAHVRLYQRDILIVENLANLTELAQQQGKCSLMVGALKHVGGTGGPARVMAVCQ